MALSRKADYALRAMVELAADTDKTMSTKKLASKAEIPYAFATKIITDLFNHGLVEVVRGNKGGVRILVDPKKTTALEVIQAISGPLSLNRCINEPKSCSRIKFCSMHEMLIRAQKELVKALSVDIEALAKSQQKKIKKVG